jgi:transposase-like protein
MDGYLAQIQPNVSDTWRTDELFIKVKGNMKYLFAMLDDETRFWIAQQVSDHKGTSDVRPMFRESRLVAGKVPTTFISDGANNFHDAYRKEFWHPYGETVSPRHIKEIRMEGKVHNNKMERFNGELRDREKVMRSLKTADTPILKGMQIYHNFVRPHESLNGDTPADRAGIKVEGVNRWFTLIQNASQNQDSLHAATR